MVYEFIICFIAGIGAELGIGFTGMGITAVANPMLITFLYIDPYETVGIALASDVFASAISAYTYGRNKNLGIPNDSTMMITVLCFTLVGSWAPGLVLSTTMDSFSVFMTLLFNIKFVVKPVVTTKESMTGISKKRRITQSAVCDIMVGFICGFVGAGGGMMMPLILTSVPGYKLKITMGTSVFIMIFAAPTGAPNHFATGGTPSIMILGMCVLSTLLQARITARFANRTNLIVLSRAIGVALAVLGVTIPAVNYLP